MTFNIGAASKTAQWRILERLIEVMPDVVRKPGKIKFVPPADSEAVQLGLPPPSAGQPVVGAGSYPARILAPDEWEPAIRCMPAIPTADRPDWIIADTLHLQPHPPDAIAALYACLPATGGYIICRHPTAGFRHADPAEREGGGILAPWDWWETRFHRTASEVRKEATPLYRAMWEFQRVRGSLYNPEEIRALESWGVMNVFLILVTPKPPKARPAPTERQKSYRARVEEAFELARARALSSPKERIRRWLDDR